jgi:hypothetical protein
VPQERALDPFLSLREAALTAAENSQVVGALEAAWLKLHEKGEVGTTAPEIAHLLLTEITVFPAAVEIAESEEKTNKEPLLSKKRLLGVGKTALDSIKDILDNLSPLAKGALTVLSEVFGIFRGD